jgi:hypothetical protein
MDKKLLRKYIDIYPTIDIEIENCERNILELEVKKDIYVKSDFDCDYIKPIIESLKESMKTNVAELSNLLTAKKKINTALSNMSTTQRRIIELRHWSGQCYPTRWADISKKLNFHKKSVERIYKSIIDLIMDS